MSDRPDDVPPNTGGHDNLPSNPSQKALGLFIELATLALVVGFIAWAIYHWFRK